MTLKRKQLSAIVLAATMVFSLFAMGTVVAVGSSAQGDYNAALGTEDVDAETANTGEAQIHNSLYDAQGETEVILRLPDLDSLDSLSAQKSYAEQTQQAVTNQLSSLDAVTVENRFWITNAILVTADLSQIDIKQLGNIKAVENVHPNFEMSIPDTPPHSVSSQDLAGDPANLSDEERERMDQFYTLPSEVLPEQLSSNQVNYTYGLEQINAPETYDEFENAGDGVRVAVIDTGVDPDHPDINITQENFAEFDANGTQIDNPTIRDTDDHGTHVSGTVVGGASSGTQIGVAPEATLMHAIGLPGGSGSFAQIIASIEWAIENNADVINLSLGAGLSGLPPEVAIAFSGPFQNARDAGVVPVAAIGNNFEGTAGVPGAEIESIAAGATNEAGDIAGFSSGKLIDTDEEFGEFAPDDYPEEYITPDYAAPGAAVVSAQPGGGFQELSGTSMASPHIAGAVAVMLSNADDLTVGEVEETLTTTATKPDDWNPEQQANNVIGGKDTRYGHGTINLLAATQLASVGDSATIVGTVTSNETGDPIEGVSISTPDNQFQATTDANGQYSIAVPATPEVTLEANDFGFAEASQTVALSGGTVTADFSVSTGQMNIKSAFENPLGDVNEDGNLTIVDAVTIRQELAGMNPEPFNETLADVNRDGDVGIIDAVLIQQNLAGMADADLSVSGLEAPDTAVPGDSITVTATVENTGGFGAVEDAEFRLAPENDSLGEAPGAAAQVVDVGPAGTQDVVFELPVPDIEPGTYNHGIFVADANATDSIVIESASDAEANFALEPALDVNLLEGQGAFEPINEEFNISVQVANIENYTVEVSDESTVDSLDVDAQLNGVPIELGETVNLDRFTGTATVTVQTVDDSGLENETLGFDHTFEGLGESVDVTTGPSELTPEVDPAQFVIENFETNDTAVMLEGNTLEASATVTNVGQEVDTQTIRWAFGDSRQVGIEIADVTLAPGESALVESPAVGGIEAFTDGGLNVRHGFSSVAGFFFGPAVIDDLATQESALLQENDSEFIVQDVTPDEGDLGEEVSVTAEVQNLGNETDTQRVRYRFAGEVVDRADVTLAPAEGPDDTTSVEFTVDLPSEQQPAAEDNIYEQAVTTEDDRLDERLAVGLDEFETTDVTIVESQFGGGADEYVSLVGSMFATSPGTETMVENASPLYSVDVVEFDDVDDTVIEETDVFVAQNLKGVPTTDFAGFFRQAPHRDGNAAFIETVEADETTGIVYLDQAGITGQETTKAITSRSLATGDPAEVTNQVFGETPVQYEVQQNHPIFDGVAEVGDRVPIHEGSLADRRFFEGTDADVIATTEGSVGGVYNGSVVAVDQNSDAVLLGTMGKSSSVDVNAYTDAAIDILGNAIDFTRDQAVGTITGQVTDTNTGDPVAGVTVEAEAEDGGPTVTAETDANGVYEINTQTPGFYVVNPVDTPDGYNTEAVVDVELGETVNQDFEVVPVDSTITGQVTDSETGEPIEGATVFDADGEAFEVETDADGEYEINVTQTDGIERGDDVAIRADAEDIGDQNVDYEQSGITVVTVGPGENVADFSLDPLPTGEVATFTDQATASSTVTQTDPSDPGVIVEDVFSSVESAVVVTYEDGGDLVIAGLEVLSASELDGNNTVTIAVNDTGGFPGTHTAHVIPTAELSGEYAPGDTVSEDTANAVLDNEDATIFQGEIVFDDQTVTGNIAEGDTLATLNASLLDGSSNDTAYVVDVHPTDEEGNLVGPEFVGSSDVLTGVNSDVVITAERVPADGEFNSFPITETDDYVAMIHVVNDGSSEGDATLPGEYPVLQHSSATGVVPGGVTDGATVTVEPTPANFTVTVDDTPNSVTAGDDIQVDYTVENVGDQQGTQDITFAVNGTDEGTESNVTLNGSETFSDSFMYTTSDGDTPEVTVAVSSANDTASETVTVEELTPANFAVSINDAASTTDVTAGEDAVINATVENTGDETATQTINFTVNGTDEGSVEVTDLAGGTTETIEFTYTAELADDGATAEVASDDDTATRTLTVTEPANFAVSINDAASTTDVTAGEDAVINATVENTGDETATQTINFTVNGTDEGSVEVTDLAGGTTETIEFTYTTELADDGATAEVASDDDTATRTLTVTEPANFAVTDLDPADTTVGAGDEFDVSANVTNTGTVEDTQEIELRLEPDGEAVANETVTLDSDETIPVTFENVSVDQTGEFNHRVASEDDVATGDLTIIEASVTINDQQAVAQAGNVTVAEASASVEYVIAIHEDDVDGDENLTFDIRGVSEVFNASETAQNVKIDVDPAFTQSQEITAMLHTVNESAENNLGQAIGVSEFVDTATLTILESDSFFNVTITDAESPVNEGEEANVTVEIENTGGVADEQEIVGTVAGPVSATFDRQTVQVDPGDNETIVLTWDTSDPGVSEAGDFTVEVSSNDTTDIAEVTVEEVDEAEFNLSNLDAPGTVNKGETFNVSVDVENIGNAKGTQNIALDIAGANVFEQQEFTLNASENATAAFEDISIGTAGEYEIEVASNDDSVSQNITVEEVVQEAEFNLSKLDAPETVDEGETFNVSVDVENIGNAAGTQNVTLDIAGANVFEQQEFTLNASENTTAAFEDISIGTAGEYEIEVASNDDSVSQNITVEEVVQEAEFNLSNLDAPETADEGETFNVSVDVENIGNAAGTQNVTLDIAGANVFEQQEFTLNASENTTAAFEDISIGTAGEYEIKVASNDDSVSQNVTVEEVVQEAEFNLSNFDAPETVDEGETFNVSVDVENIGNAAGTQNVTLDIAGANVFEQQEFTLNASENATAAFEDISIGTAGEYEIEVASNDDSVSQNITVEEVVQEAEFDVALETGSQSIDVDYNDFGDESDPFDIEVNVTNVGDATGTQDITLDVTGPDGSVVLDNTTEVSGLAPGESETVTFADLRTSTPGEFNHEVSSEDDADTGTINVIFEDSAFYLVTDLEAPAEAAQGQTITVNATVTNVGETESSQDIEFRLDPDGDFSNPDVDELIEPSLVLTPDESRELSINVDVPAGSGTYEHGIFSEDDNATTQLEVPGEFFKITVTETNEPVNAGDELNVTAAVENTGDVDGTQTVTLNINDSIGQVDSEQVSLNSSETETVTLTWATGSDDSGSYEATVSSENDNDAVSVGVLKPTFEVSDLQPTSATVTEGADPIDVSATVENTGGADGQQTVVLSVTDGQGDEELNQTKTVNLNSGANQTVTFSDVDIGSLAPGDYSHEIASDDDAASGSLTVESASSFFEVSNLQPPSATVTEGADPIDVSATVENTGGADGQQTVVLSVTDGQGDEELNQTKTVNLNSGANQTVTFSDVDVGSLAPGDYSHEIASDDDAASGSLTIEASAASFDVTITGTNEPVTEGGDLNVTAQVENTGTEQGSQSIRLEISDGIGQQDSQSLTLSPSQTDTVVLTWPTSVGEAGNYDATVASDNTTDTQPVTIDAESGDANFQVSIVDQTNETVAGATQSFDIQLENTGDGEGTQTIKVDWGNGTHTNSTDVTLGVGETTTETLSVQTDSDEFLGEYDVSVESLNDTATTGAQIIPERVISTDSAAPGDTVSVTVSGELDSPKNVSLIETFNRTDGGSEDAFPAATYNGSGFNPTVNSFDNTGGVYSAFAGDFPESGSATLEFNYEITLPSGAAGEAFGFESGTSLFEIAGTEFSIGGDDAIAIVASSSTTQSAAVVAAP